VSIGSGWMILAESKSAYRHAKAATNAKATDMPAMIMRM
jgi:hypothetical protein